MKKNRQHLSSHTIIIPGPALFNLVLLSAAFVVFLYAYFLASSVIYVAATKELARDLLTTERSAVQLESRYLLVLGQLSREAAAARGYQDIAKVHYVERGGGALTLVRYGE